MHLTKTSPHGERGALGRRASAVRFSQDFTVLTVFGIVLSLLVPTAALAGPGPRKSHTLPTTKTVPQLDGDLSDACWKGALRVESFARFGGSTPVSERTEAWATTDGKTLYVAFHCHDSHPELIRASETQRGSGAVYGDDHITVLIDSQHQHRGLSAFSINPLGTLYHTLEGGTADNITWAGDWRGASKRVADGWTCELAIPFGLMRHPTKSKVFGMQLIRQLAREPNFVIWPAVPSEAQSLSLLAQNAPDIHLAQPMPDATPKPVFLPYTIGTAKSNGESGRVGLDIKYPFSTTLTGLMAINPDFQTIEQNVASVNFSYNEQFVADRRPFFAEGSEFLPDADLFYSQRIPQFDTGMKVVGRDGATSIGLVASEARSTKTDRDAMAFSLKQAIGLYSEVGVSGTADNLYGLVASRVARAHGTYGWLAKDRRNTFYARRTQSWLGAQPKGSDSVLYLNSSATNGKPSYTLIRSQLSADFISTLGLIQNQDRQGWSVSTGLHNQFDRGRLFSYDLKLDYNQADRLTSGAFFYENLTSTASVQTRKGTSLSLDASQGRREDSATTRYKDFSTGIGLGWNQRTLFQGGGLRVGQGRQGGLPTTDLNFGQGFLVSKPLSVSTSYNQQKRGTTTTRQAIATGTFRLDTLRTLSARLISQNGSGNAANVGARNGTNLYLAYTQRSRSNGADIFVILGDPNANNTKTQATLKLVRPY
ncbi:carbohydrate binding family 9 domain-containing protein [Armatimonas rosea]|uniref:Carbohydrate binding protein with CBM9 domain n=1 Tax=Armatimonas rosea TaxID=685828 RepID=A0A7W9SR15_ARMRO|nr:carbohydrate binding family 9 domain-containing protein [Armatimonas rosea]MBB6050443.1 hypothetical protein [Armatimonas rosea]